GLEAVEPSALELMRVLSANRRQVFFKLRLPSSLPFLFSALKIATASCVIGAIVAEWVGADTGLGYLIIVATFEFRTGLLYATTAVGSFLALSFFLAVVLVEKAVVRWKPETPATWTWSLHRRAPRCCWPIRSSRSTPGGRSTHRAPSRSRARRSALSDRLQ